jgi:S1-C subfamily serine protease
MRERGLRTIALALSCTAVALAVVATVIVVRRSAPATIETRVSAATFAKLVPGSFVDAAPGIRVRDPELARALALDDGDIVVSLAGVPTHGVGDVVPAMAGVVPAAATLYAEIVRGDEHVLARWSLEARQARADDSLAGTIRAIDGQHIVLPRHTMDAIFDDPMSAARSMRFVPASGGYKVYAIQPGSVARAIGLENGDLIRGINGFEVASREQALEVYAAMRDAREITVDLVRRGNPLTIHIDVTK